MTKNKILILVVAALLLTNIAMLVFFLNKPAARRGFKRDREAAMTEFLQRDIGFSQQQMQQYDSFSRLHQEKIKAMMDSIRETKEQMLKNIAAGNFSDSALDNTASLSAGKQKELELLMLRHFKDIRSLCTQPQQAKFDTLYYKLWRHRGEPTKKTDDKK